MAATEMESRTQKMGIFGAISYIIGNVVGSGIFITPASIFGYVNSVGLSLVVWLLSALIAMLGSFCYVELGTSIRLSGADFAYICYVKWYPLAFMFMCTGCLILYPATLAIQALTFSEYVFKGCGINGLSDQELYYAKKLCSFSIMCRLHFIMETRLLMFLNFFSLKTFVARFNIVASIAKIAALGIVIGVGFYYLTIKGHNEHLQEPFKGSNFALGAFVSALLSGLYSYDGWDILNFGAEEIHKPKRTMPVAIVLGLSVIAILFLAVNVAFFVVLDLQDFEESSAVAETFGAKTLGEAKVLIPIFVALLLVGSLNSTLFSASRYLQAAARQGHLPTMIACINQENDSPRVALFIHVLLAMGISFFGDLNTLIQYVAFSQWSQRAITMAALIYIRLRPLSVHPDAIHVPLLFPLLFFLVCSALVVLTALDSVLVASIGFGMLLIAFLLFLIFMYDRSLRSIPEFLHAMQALDGATTGYAQIIFNVMPDLTNVEAVAMGGHFPTQPTKVYPALSVTSIGVVSSASESLRHRPTSLRAVKGSISSHLRF